MFSKQAHSKITLPFFRIAPVLAPGLLAIFIAHTFYQLYTPLVDLENNFAPIPIDLYAEIYLYGIYLEWFLFFLLFAEIFYRFEGTVAGHKTLLIAQLAVAFPASVSWMNSPNDWNRQAEINLNLSLCVILCLHIAAFFLLHHLGKNTTNTCFVSTIDNSQPPARPE